VLDTNRQTDRQDRQTDKTDRHRQDFNGPPWTCMSCPTTTLLVCTHVRTYFDYLWSYIYPEPAITA